MISVIIPNRNRGGWRLKEVIKRLKNDMIKEIIVIDYGSDKPLEIGKDTPKWDNIKIIRYDKTKEFNKAHAINIGAKKAKGKFLMTVDADVLLGPNFFSKIKEYLTDNSFIYTNMVKRIEKEDMCDDWSKCVGRATNWYDNNDPILQAHHTATGGFQLFPKWWFDKIRGIDENFVFYGGMDNITIIDARRSKLDLTILNETILHLEHPEKKEDNLPQEIKDLAKYIRSERPNFMRKILQLEYIKNPRYWGSLKKPNWLIYQQQKKAYEYAISHKPEGFEFSRDTKIMIVIINNKEYIPKRFVQNIYKVYEFTKRIFPKTDLNYVSAAQVNNMRNIAVQKAIELDYDYLVCVDDDHDYVNDFIIKLLGRDKDFITGCTKGRVKPYEPTQFYKFQMPLKTPDNFVYTDGKDGIIQIEVSGPVGMLMKVSALKRLKYPYYKMDYSYEIDGEPNPLGGDYYFCKQLKDAGFQLYLDTSVHFPHYISGVVLGHGENPKIKTV